MPFDATDYREVRLLDRDPKTLTDPRERLEYLRDFLRELPAERFNMAVYSDDGFGNEVSAQDFHTCGTAACICGWAISKFSDHDTLSDDDKGAELLGIDYENAFRLFIPSHKFRSEITNTEAANVLDHLLKTGEVDWSVA